MTLNEIGIKHKTDKATYHKYMNFYESNFEHLKNRDINLLEIGFFNGASIKTWLEYFPNANIYCIDIIDINFKNDRFFYNKISQDNNNLSIFYKDYFFDIIIDDGSHMTSHQNKSLELLWPKLKKNGFYVIEDLHTSFNKSYIDSPVTPYEFLNKQSSIKEIDYIILEAKYIKIFHKEENIFTDSITSLIKK